MVCLSGKVGVGEAALGAAWMPFLADELLDGFNRQRSVLANHFRGKSIQQHAPGRLQLGLVGTTLQPLL